MSEAELEGAFIDLKDRMTDAEIVAGWAESGERAAAERVEAKRSKTMFFVSVREPVSEVFRAELLEMGFRFSTRSLRYATIVAAELPDGLVALAASNDQSVWTLDENADKLFVHRADGKGRVGANGVEGERAPEAAQSRMFNGRTRGEKASVDPASQDGVNSAAIEQDSVQSG